MKVYLAAPGQHTWPNIPDPIQDRLRAILAEHFNDGMSLKRTRKKSADASKHPIKQHLAIGLRCVLRCLQQKQCSLVLVCTSLSPMILTKPLLLLSQMHSTPSIRLKNLATLLTNLFAIPRCATLAFKLSGQENAQLRALTDSLFEVLDSSEKPPAVSFLPGKILAPYQNPTRVPAGVQKKKKKTKPAKK